jgi:flagellar basal body-associated protein FliL
LKLWTGGSKLKQKMAKYLPFMPKLSFKIKMKRTALRLSFAEFKEKAKYKIKNAPSLLLAWFKEKAGATKGRISEVLAIFQLFSWQKKLATVALIAATGAGGYIIFRAAHHKIIPEQEDLFINSMESWAQEKYLFTAEETLEPFYESTRVAQNIIALKKMVVNLKRSPGSGPNPMGMFEFYLEGVASDVVVEVKDREIEVQDLFQRTLEETTYDQAATAEGKQALCQRLRKEVNNLLTKGKIRRVFIKTFVIKP